MEAIHGPKTHGGHEVNGKRLTWQPTATLFTAAAPKAYLTLVGTRLTLFKLALETTRPLCKTWEEMKKTGATMWTGFCRHAVSVLLREFEV
mmetsp:Transcript_93003/g.165406  ORF Transcript_93003/g.165406 Transcript_93003/m.165406 type:complete len:91 (-) Transcript_93003:804-1076(-)